jgi:hypothetical protein
MPSFTPEEAFKFANHVPHPEVVAIIFLVCAAITLVLALRAKRQIIGSLAAVLLIALGCSPLYANHVLRGLGAYHVQVALVRPDGSPVYYAQLKSSQSSEMKICEGGWRLEVPRQEHPVDNKVSFSVSVKDEFLKGGASLTLADDYYPTVTIPLVADTSAKIKGVVVDEKMVAVSGAIVSVAGFPDTTITDRKGNFALPAHAGNGQLVEVHAEKDGVMTHLKAPAGKFAEVVLGSE